MRCVVGGVAPLLKKRSRYTYGEVTSIRVIRGHSTISTFVVGQHGVLCEVKRSRFIALFEQN